MLSLLPVCLVWHLLSLGTVHADITCSAGVFITGSTATVVCDFGDNINTTKTNFNIVMYRSSDDSNGNYVLVCNWNTQDLECKNLEGYSLQGSVTNTIRVQIHDVQHSMAGVYVCQIVPADDNPVKICLLNVTDPTTTTTRAPSLTMAHLKSTSTGTKTTALPEEQGTHSMHDAETPKSDSAGRVVGIAVGVCLTVVGLITAVCILIWRKRRLHTRNMGSSDDPGNEKGVSQNIDDDDNKSHAGNVTTVNEVKSKTTPQPPGQCEPAEEEPSTQDTHPLLGPAVKDVDRNSNESDVLVNSKTSKTAPHPPDQCVSTEVQTSPQEAEPLLGPTVKDIDTNSNESAVLVNNNTSKTPPHPPDQCVSTEEETSPQEAEPLKDCNEDTSRVQHINSSDTEEDEEEGRGQEKSVNRQQQQQPQHDDKEEDNGHSQQEKDRIHPQQQRQPVEKDHSRLQQRQRRKENRLQQQQLQRNGLEEKREKQQKEQEDRNCLEHQRQEEEKQRQAEEKQRQRLAQKQRQQRQQKEEEENRHRKEKPQRPQRQQPENPSNYGDNHVQSQNHNQGSLSSQPHPTQMETHKEHAELKGLPSYSGQRRGRSRNDRLKNSSQPANNDNHDDGKLSDASAQHGAPQICFNTTRVSANLTTAL